ncbi:hypothetical protein FACS189413_00920 [Bacteroidia bacterium]|nr:hypothetical protein FACS189413_00920 [Bacteroidia bacterium]
MAITLVSINQANVLHPDLSKVYSQAKASNNKVVRVSGEKPPTLREIENPVPFRFYDYYDIRDFVLTEDGYLHLSVYVSFLEEQKRFTFKGHFFDRDTEQYIGDVDFPVIESIKTGDAHQYINADGFDLRRVSVMVECIVEHSDDMQSRLFASRQSCAFADIQIDPQYDHIYPKKEKLTIAFGHYDDSDKNPAVYTHDPNHIVISLFRRPQDSGDSDYVCNYGKDASNQPYIAIPGKGVIRLGRSVIIEKPEDITDLYAYLESIDGGFASVTSTQISISGSGGFPITDGDIQYELATNWGMAIKQTGDLKPYNYNFMLSFNINYHLKSGGQQTLSFLVTSKSVPAQATATNLTYLILPLRIMWGCLAKGTLILTSRGEIPIEAIKIGDTLTGRESNRVVTVRNIWTGDEADMVKVSYQGGNILLTTHHPVYTIAGGKRQIKRASALMMSDILAGRNENYGITDIETVPYNDTVYNLSLDGDNGFFANGIFVGDMDTQNNQEI